MRNLCRSRVPGRRRQDETGVAAVEFALIFCFLLVPLVMGMLQFGWYFYASQVTGSAARETARRLSVGDCQAPGRAQAFARRQSNFSGLALTFGTPTTQNDVLPTGGDILQVRTSTDGSIVGFLPLPNDGQVTRTVETRVEDRTEDSPC